MQELILALAGLILELLVFFCAGSLLTRILKIKAEVTMELIIGYLLYFAVFEILAVPMTLKWVKLSTFSHIWLVVMAACVLAACLCAHKMWNRQLNRIGEVFQRHWLLLILVAAVVIFQCFLVAAYQDGTADATHYIGTVSTSVYTDTLARYSPLTGVLQKNFNLRYDLSAYPMHNAVWCVLLGIHPMVQSKVVMSVINMLMINLLIYQIGKNLFHGDEKKADLMVLFVCLMQMFSFSIYTTGTFAFMRVYEGKALLANISIPAALLVSIRLWLGEKEQKMGTWVFLFLASVSALTFSGSSLIYPAVVSTAVLPVMLLKKKLSYAIPYALCMLPGFLYALVYFAAKLGWIAFPAS